jgi:hypothetical protein
MPMVLPVSTSALRRRSGHLPASACRHVGVVEPAIVHESLTFSKAICISCSTGLVTLLSAPLDGAHGLVVVRRSVIDASRLPGCGTISNPCRSPHGSSLGER